MKKSAFLFPGQGSQSPGMLAAWGELPCVRDTVQEASDALGEDLHLLIAQGTKEQLGLTTNTQPVMLVAGVAAYRAWRAAGHSAPEVMAGHSLGEYSALVCAGVIGLADAARLVRFRAQAMQDAVPVGVGAMAAVLGLASERVIEGCRIAQLELSEETVQAVNFNDPAQTVIAGTVLGVNKACEVLKSLGAKRALILPVSAPFHSRLMQPAADKLREQLALTHFNSPQIAVINNVDVMIQNDPERIKESLYRQAFNAVRWVEIIHSIKAMGIGFTVECGPGKVLSGFSTRIDSTLHSAPLYDPVTLEQVAALLNGE